MTFKTLNLNLYGKPCRDDALIKHSRILIQWGERGGGGNQIKQIQITAKKKKKIINSTLKHWKEEIKDRKLFIITESYLTAVSQPVELSGFKTFPQILYVTFDWKKISLEKQIPRSRLFVGDGQQMTELSGRL